MPLDSYVNLQTAIIEYAMRQADSEFIARVPDFITLLEKRASRVLRLSNMMATATITLTNGEGVLPADYEAFRIVSPVGSPRVSLELTTPEYAMEFFPDDTPGQAQYFTLIGNAIKTYRPSSENLNMVYYKTIPALSLGVNWLLTKAPDIYLYGSLLEAMPYMEDDTRAQTWGVFLDRAFKELKDADIRGRYSRISTRILGPTP